MLPQVHELQVIVDKLKAIKIELPELFQLGEILPHIQRHLRIEEESRVRNKIVSSYDGLSKANSVDNVAHSNKYKKKEKPLGPKKD